MTEEVMAMLSIAKDGNFSSKGMIDKCFASNLKGGIEEVPCSLKVHPIYKTLVKPFSKEIVAMSNPDNTSELVRVKANKNTRFFNKYGDALLWYYVLPNGSIEFFNQPGLHPQFNESLFPVTKIIVQKFFVYLDEEKKRIEDEKRKMIKMDEEMMNNLEDPELKSFYKLSQDIQGGGDSNGTRN